MRNHQLFSIALLVLGTVSVLAAPNPLHAAPIITPGAGSFQFVDNLGNADKPIRVWFYCPDQLTPTTPIVFVMHGVQRNGERYRNEWQDYAQKYNFLLLCPEFDEQNYPTDAYQWGNMFDAQKHPVPESKWTFTAVEHLFDYAKNATGDASPTYFIFGHSAGGQFVHRFALLMPHARYARAIAANPGWYTMPTYTGHKFPYSLRDSNLPEARLRESFGRDFLLMLGEEDQDPNDPELRKTAEAEEQGKTRFERGHTYFTAAQAEAASLHANFNWQMATVPGAHHSDKQMARAAILQFFKNSDSP
jgi:poly(3-hydroxybutyrate) depolymerase